MVDATLLDSGAGVTDKRLRIVVAMLREAFLPTSRQRVAVLEWVNTHKMLADALTTVLAGAPAIVAAMAAVKYKPPPGKLGRAVSVARGSQLTSSPRKAVGALCIPLSV